MAWFHPIIQACATFLALYVLTLGLLRFRQAHLGHRTAAFPWRRHVRLGAAVLILWLTGTAGGLFHTAVVWKNPGVTGLHFTLAMTMLPLLAAGLVTGLVLDRNRKRRTALPLVHGAVNALLTVLALGQAVSGLFVIRKFLL